jgi:hypothetical protein
MEDFNINFSDQKEHQTQALKKSNPVVHGGDKWWHQSGVGEIPWNSSTIAINIVDEKENSLQMLTIGAFIGTLNNQKTKSSTDSVQKIIKTKLNRSKNSWEEQPKT